MAPTELSWICFAKCSKLALQQDPQVVVRRSIDLALAVQTVTAENIRNNGLAPPTVEAVPLLLRAGRRPVRELEVTVGAVAFAAKLRRQASAGGGSSAGAEGPFSSETSAGGTDTLMSSGADGAAAPLPDGNVQLVSPVSSLK